MKILVVDDDEVTRKLLEEVLQKSGYEVRLAASGEDAIALLRSGEYPIVVSDIRMIDADGLAVLDFVRVNSLDSVVILMTGFGSMETAVEAIRKGAFDYISKPFKIEELKAVIERARDHWDGARKAKSPVTAVAPGSLRPGTLIGKAPAIVDVYKLLARAALSDSNVLISGESGTGKELVARAIHENSLRRGSRFVAVNCGALAETLLESELFGYVKGAFTGATGNKRGLFEEADQGTVFLDEIGDIPASLQVKLLRILQEGELKPVGSSEIRKVNVRVIAATHRDLGQMVKAGTFREDLFYRLKVLAIELPPLRHRMQDLDELLNYFLARYSEKNRKNVSHVSNEALALLRAYRWPGNIRELEHAVEHAVAMTRTSILFPEDFPTEIGRTETSAREDGGGDTGAHARGPAPRLASLEEIEREHIVNVLRDVGYNKSKASEVLGIDRATLYRKAQRYGIPLERRED